MKHFNILLLLFFTACAIPSSAQWTYKDFRKLKNLEGSWEMNNGKSYIQEKWTRVNDSTFEGKNYSITRGVVILEERMKIVLTNEGIFFIATVTYQNKGLPVSFKLISTKNDEFIFENKEHDFPQQVMYHVKGDDKLLAFINGNTEKGFKKIDFSFYRMLR
ncbi:hypothetical protein F0919_04525 [Taibaiella lutea]|uniref:DUF6265 domain-containing protein n=1 Tax=Taibaiella lutea TaxID=2608001 RepID=A0A5M6CPR5_9BACT|nr:DUF6265 family protein [Taibaiella lutea]KAA5536943.1 hypothetical protein F0919_04525 [Taibaiella lutea]